MTTHALASRRHAITLLEVLISIGILSVGLIGALSLIPVGRTYLTKAAADDRVTTVIPAAYDTMMSMGLFAENSLSWISSSRNHPENESESGDNDDPSDAETLPLRLLDTETSQGRIEFVKQAAVTVRGNVSGPGDEDWYRVSVEAGQILTIEAGDINNLNPGPADAPAAERRLLPVFRGGSQQMSPRDEPGKSSYSVTQDGNMWIQALGGTAGAYEFTVRVERPDRVIAVDPLMASRLDQLLGGNSGGASPLALRRRYFADFSQSGGSNSSRAFRIPRLSWQRLATQDLNQGVALADWMCRMRDDLEMDDTVAAESANTPPDEFAAPQPGYVKGGGGEPLCRKAAGRMSWLITLQPQDPGSVADNWQAGRIFDASIAILQDRELPSGGNRQVNGEYAFRATWEPAGGMLYVAVPQSFIVNGEELYLDEDDVRAIFRTGAWLLLAPSVASTAPPVENRERLAWIRIRTAELERSTADGEPMIIAALLLETEPPADLLLGTAGPTGGIPLVALVHEGVVAVVTKQVKIQAAQ